MTVNQDTHNIKELSLRITITESFPEIMHSQFRDYCASSNIIYVDELQPYDYVAFKKQSKADADIIKQIRVKVKTILSDNTIIPANLGEIKPEFHQPTNMQLDNGDHTNTWESALRVTANAYISTPLENINIPNRVRHRLESAGITTIGQMLLTTPDQFLTVGYLGEHSLEVIKSISMELVRDFTNQGTPFHKSSLVSNLEWGIETDNGHQANSTKHQENLSCNGLRHESKYTNALRTVAAYDSMSCPIDSLELSRRIYHRLQYAGIDTVGKLLLATDELLLGIKNLGQKGVLKIREAVDDYLENYLDQNPDWQAKKDGLPVEIQHVSSQHPSDPEMIITDEFRGYVERLLSGLPSSYYQAKLTTIESQNEERVRQSIQVIGLDLCKLAYYDPLNTRAVIQGFQSYINFQNALQVIQNLDSSIPESRRTKLLSPYVKLFNGLHIYTIKDQALIFPGCKTIGDIRDNITIIAALENQHIIRAFLEWLSFDFVEFVEPAITASVGGGRKEQMLSRRAAGETLESVSTAYKLTRERIRQIEHQIGQAFLNYQRSHPILLAISAELNGETVIVSEDIQRVIPNSSLLIYLLKKHPDSNFIYDKHFECFFLPNEVDRDVVYDVVSNLPGLINESTLETLIDQLCDQKNIPYKLLQLAFRKRYQRTGTIWHAGKLSRASMYSIIMERYFPNGLRIYDAEELSRFKKYVHEVFGETGHSENDRALWGIIQRIATLYDRGVYIHPTRVSIPDDLVNQIEEYFVHSGRTSMTYHELYDRFSEELLLLANITNRYALQGILKDKLDGKFVFYKNGISTIEGYKITQEIETYIYKNSPVMKETVMIAFSGITEAMLMQNIARLPSVILIDNSTFLHADGLKLIANDYKIQELIRELTVEHPVSASKLMDILYKKHSDFLCRNNIDSPSTLFGILQYMFSEEFAFSRPYIGLHETNGISKRDIIVTLLDGQERVEISHVYSLCEEHHLAFQSLPVMVRALESDYIQADKDTLVSVKSIFVTDTNLNRIKELLRNAIGYKGYSPFIVIDNYIFYPDLGIPWTHFLLRSMIEKYLSADFRVIDNPTIQDISFDLIVESRLDINSYDELIRSVVSAEHHRDPFKDQAHLVKWLINEGLVTRKAMIEEKSGSGNSPALRLVNSRLPKLLLDESFMYSDEFGNLIVR